VQRHGRSLRDCTAARRSCSITGGGRSGFTRRTDAMVPLRIFDKHESAFVVRFVLRQNQSMTTKVAMMTMMLLFLRLAVVFFFFAVGFSVPPFPDPSLQHFHPAPVARVVVNRTLLRGIPTQQQQRVRCRIGRHQVARVVLAGIEVRVLFPLTPIAFVLQIDATVVVGERCARERDGARGRERRVRIREEEGRRRRKLRGREKNKTNKNSSL